MAGTFAKGTRLYKGAVYVGNVITFNGIAIDSDEIDVTDHESAQHFEEVIQGVRRTGILSLDIHLNPDDDGQNELYQDVLTGAVNSWRVEFPTDPVSEFACAMFVKKAMDISAPTEDKLTTSAELRMTGVPEFNTDYSADLSTLTFSNGTLAPTFAGDVYEYVLEAVTLTAIDVTVTATNDAVFVNGQELPGDGGTITVELGAVGDKFRIVVEGKDDGEVPRRYVICGVVGS